MRSVLQQNKNTVQGLSRQIILTDASFVIGALRLISASPLLSQVIMTMALSRLRDYLPSPSLTYFHTMQHCSVSSPFPSLLIDLLDRKSVV